MAQPTQDNLSQLLSPPPPPRTLPALVHLVVDQCLPFWSTCVLAHLTHMSSESDQHVWTSALSVAAGLTLGRVVVWPRCEWVKGHRWKSESPLGLYECLCTYVSESHLKVFMGFKNFLNYLKIH